MTATGYEPLDTLKPVADDIWIIDGPHVRFMRLPFSTRATVIRLANGDLWVHSPTRLTPGLRAEIEALGPVRHLIAPNWLHYAHLADWQAAWPGALAWGAPGVAERAAKNGLALHIDHPLQGRQAEAPWAGQIGQLVVRGSRLHQEAVFFHEASRTLIVTDLIEAFETAKLPVWMRPIVWLAGVDDSDGKMPPDMWWSFRDKAALAEDVETMIGWGPRRLILAHGRWYEKGGAAELERAFRKLLRVHRWEAAYDRARAAQERGEGER
jgi:hypothetical protein